MKLLHILSSITLLSYLSANSSIAVAQVSQLHRGNENLQEARRRAQLIQVNFPLWYEELPACPCSVSEARANPKNFTESTLAEDASIIPFFHPGAAVDFRSVKENIVILDSRSSTQTELPTIYAGQQCTYDSNENLITRGPGAGTPDIIAPNYTAYGQGLVSSESHTYWDIDTFDPSGLEYGVNGLPWYEYQRTWVPNTGVGCAPNPAGDLLYVEVGENPNATTSYYWDVPFDNTEAPDIDVYVYDRLVLSCQDSYVCFGSGNLPEGDLQITIRDRDVFDDDFVGQGICPSNGLCQVGAAEIFISREQIGH
ncbi:MAG: hypothetical protein KME16_26820 [Scytolyngbya sp. HA4215-MV1]|nr:hypothetical protein [Scytolyngbya sp. HA4215-MV1]